MAEDLENDSQSERTQWEIVEGEEATKMWPGATRIEKDITYPELVPGGQHYFIFREGESTLEVLNGYLYDPSDATGGQIGTPLE